MKRKFSFIILIYSIILLVGCGWFGNGQEVVLTHEEKFALIQKIETPTFELVRLNMELDFDSPSYLDERLIIKGKMETWTNLKSEEDFFSYSLLDLEVNAQNFEIVGKGISYLTKDKAYLNIDANTKSNGSTISIKGKEVMNLEYLYPGFDPSIIDFSELWKEITEYKYEDVPNKEALDQLLDFIKIYKRGTTTTLVVEVTKDKLVNLEDVSQEIYEIFNSISNDSKLELTIVIENNKLQSIKFLTNFSMDYDGNKIDLNAKVELVLNAKKPSLPSKTELAAYTEVEMFTLFEQLFNLRLN